MLLLGQHTRLVPAVLPSLNKDFIILLLSANTSLIKVVSLFTIFLLSSAIKKLRLNELFFKSLANVI